MPNKPVSSEQLLAFIEKAAIHELKLNADGDPFYELQPSLQGDALASALATTASLAKIEHEVAFSREHAKCGDRPPLPGVGGLAN